jgi:hypothetical protein
VFFVGACDSGADMTDWRGLPGVCKKSKQFDLFVLWEKSGAYAINDYAD